MESVLINLSGHLLNNTAKDILYDKYSSIEDVSFIAVDFSANIEHELKNIIKRIDTKLDGSIAITIIPPGQSTLAVLMVTYLHGLLGYFPAICYLQQTSSGEFTPLATYHIDGYSLRKAGRVYRQEIWKNSLNNDTV